MDGQAPDATNAGRDLQCTNMYPRRGKKFRVTSASSAPAAINS
jgi:hypothetical protein